MFNNVELPVISSDEIISEVRERVKKNPQISDSKKEQIVNVLDYLSHEEIKNQEKEYDDKFTSSEESSMIKYNQYIKENFKFKISELWKLINSYGSNTLSSIKDQTICPSCGLSVNETTNNNRKKSIEHILPKSLYNNYILYPNNLVMMCEKCNTFKGDKDVSITEVYHPYFSDWIVPLENLEVRIWVRRDTFNYEFILNSDDIISNNFEKVFKVKSIYYEFIELYLNERLNSLNRFDNILEKDVLEDFKEEKEKFDLKHLASQGEQNDFYIISLALENFIANFTDFIKLKEGFNSIL